MPVTARACEWVEIAPLRELYRQESACQIVFDSLYTRPGWTREFALESGGTLIGHASVAVAGPWTEKPALYEFYLRPEHRALTFPGFDAFRPVCGTRFIETQSNTGVLPVLLLAFGRNIQCEAIVFADGVQTAHLPPGAAFRAATEADAEALSRHELDGEAGWVVTIDGELAGAGDVLYHYNRPYGDVYMKVAEPFRRRGLGAYLVQELKAVCRAGGSIPAARCNANNRPSRLTLQRAGFVPCGNLLSGELPE